jgi:hypothetical protein
MDIEKIRADQARTGVPGLDGVLAGGLTAGHLFLLEGTGKMFAASLGCNGWLHCGRAHRREIVEPQINQPRFVQDSWEKAGEEACNGDLVMEFFETFSSFRSFLRASLQE